MNKKYRKERKRSNAKVTIMTATICMWLITEVKLLAESTVKPKIKIRKTMSLAVLTFSLILSVYYALDMVMWNYCWN